MPAALFVCEHCHVQFKPKRKANFRFCSRNCSFKKLKEKAAIALEIKNLNAALCKAENKVFYQIQCVVCSEPFMPSQSNNKICSRACKLSRARYAVREYNKQHSVIDKAERHCLECGGVFAPIYGDKRRMYCSASCSNRSHRRTTRKKAKILKRLLTVESVNPSKVFDRDGWRCQLCGCKTLRSKRGSTHRKAPELDHILPLSKGGAHSYLNTQCACRQCNGIKGATPLGQTLLFG